MIVFDDKINPKLPTPMEIKEYETSLGAYLPQAYINILEKHNGSSPEPYRFSIIWNGEEEKYGVGQFIELRKGGEFGSLNDYIELLHVDHGISEKIIPFAIDAGGNLICFDYRESDLNPKIVFWKHDEDRGLDFVADSFDEFLSNLY